MKWHLWKRFAALIVACIAATFPFGGVAAAQSDIQIGPGDVVEVTLGEFKTTQCQEPPCGPEPPPSQYGSCDLRITGPVFADPTEVTAVGIVECKLANGNPFNVARLDSQTTLASASERLDTEGREETNASSIATRAELPYACESYQAFSSSNITLPLGWVWAPGADGSLFMYTLHRHICPD